MSATVLTPVSDAGWIADFLRAHWQTDVVVGKGRTIGAGELSGVRAERDGRVVGFIGWRILGDELEVVSLDSLEPGTGIGTLLLDHVVGMARVLGLRRLWLVTTNDNLDALRFYQRRGMKFCALYPNALEASRRIKPQIPTIGSYGIPIRDELELEMVLT